MTDKPPYHITRRSFFGLMGVITGGIVCLQHAGLSGPVIVRETGKSGSSGGFYFNEKMCVVLNRQINIQAGMFASTISTEDANQAAVRWAFSQYSE